MVFCPRSLLSLRSITRRVLGELRRGRTVGRRTGRARGDSEHSDSASSKPSISLLWKHRPQAPLPRPVASSTASIGLYLQRVGEINQPQRGCAGAPCEASGGPAAAVTLTKAIWPGYGSGDRLALRSKTETGWLPCSLYARVPRVC